MKTMIDKVKESVEGDTVQQLVNEHCSMRMRNGVADRLNLHMQPDLIRAPE